jgi:hypothetical protein
MLSALMLVRIMVAALAGPNSWLTSHLSRGYRTSAS